jgi:hypothetical protein
VEFTLFDHGQMLVSDEELDEVFGFFPEQEQDGPP